MTACKKFQFSTPYEVKQAEQEGSIFDGHSDCDIALEINGTLASYWRWYPLIDADSNLIQLPKVLRANSKIADNNQGIWVHQIITE